MKKRILCLMVAMSLCINVGCTRKNTENKVNKNENKIEKISEKEDISDEYLKKRYPGKKIVHWLYSDIIEFTKSEIEYGFKYGQHAVTNEQVIRLNDYIVSKGKDFVINYKNVGKGCNYLTKVKQMIKDNNSPDVLTIDSYMKENVVDVLNIKYDFIKEGLLEELTPYLSGQLKEYKKAFPENIYKMSHINGKFYGMENAFISSGTFGNKYAWYVNEDLAKKYCINVDDMKQMDYEDWKSYLEKVYNGEKNKKNNNLRMISYVESPIFSDYITGYVGTLCGKNLKSIPILQYDAKERKIVNCLNNEKAKKEIKAFTDYKKSKYFSYINKSIKEKDMLSKNIFLTAVCEGIDSGGSSYRHAVDDIKDEYSQVKKMKRINWQTVTKYGTDKQLGVTGICTSSKNKEAAMEALNFIYSDSDASNIVVDPEYRVEKKQKSQELFIRGYENYCGCSSNMYNDLKTFPKDVYKEKIKEINSYKVDDKIAGRIFDFTKIEKQINDIMKIEEKYCDKWKKSPLVKGNFETEWNNFMKELDNAGMEQVLKELNKQLG